MGNKKKKKVIKINKKAYTEFKEAKRQAEINELMESLEQSEPQKIESCYVFSVKNNTDEKHYNVELLNYEHEKNRKISYELKTGMTYSDFMRQVQVKGNEVIKMIRIHSLCDYGKFQAKQCLATLTFKSEYANGSSYSTPVFAHPDPMQMQSNIVEKNELNYKLNVYTQIKLEYLMPETEIVVCLFTERELNY